MRNVTLKNLLKRKEWQDKTQERVLCLHYVAFSQMHAVSERFFTFVPDEYVRRNAL